MLPTPGKDNLSLSLFLKIRNIKTMEFYFDEKQVYNHLVNEEQTLHLPIP